MEALKSIASQTFQDYEVVVVDDGSSEAVLNVTSRQIEEFGPRFRFFPPSAPGCRGSGPSGARNRGAKYAKGEYLGFLDDDDLFLAKDFAATAVRVLTQDGGDYFFALVKSSKNGNEFVPVWSVTQESIERWGKATNLTDVYALDRRAIYRVARPYVIHPGQCVMRRSVFEDCGGFFEGLWSHDEDKNLMLRVLDRASGVFCWTQTGLYYRWPTGNSVSLAQSSEMHILQGMLSSEHARLSCKRRDMRCAARASLSWWLRELASLHLTRGNGYEAFFNSLAAVALFPSAGSVSSFARMALRIALGDKLKS